MTKEENFIRHEVLNVLTLINFVVAALSISKSEKNELMKLLKKVSTFIAYEDVLLGKKLELVQHKFELKKLVEIIQLTSEFEMEKVPTTFSSTSMEMVGDKNAVKEGLEQVLKAVINVAKKVNVEIDDEKRVMKIQYESTEKIEPMVENLITCLSNKKCAQNITYQIALHLMVMNGVKIEFKKNIVKIKFSEI